MRAVEQVAGARPAAREVLVAARRIADIARRTPLEHSPSLSAAAGAQAWIKLENLQRTGSFKLRGAANAVLALSGEERANGVVTASAGNHGLGVAFAARRCGIPATIFTPATASRVKRERITRLGAMLHEIPGSYEDAHGRAISHAHATNAYYLHAFSDPAVVAGQGTVALEILEELPEVATLLVPVGGGGLIGGVGILARALDPRIRVVGVQSELTAAMHASLRAGQVVSPPREGPTLCDGLAGTIDESSLALARQVVEEVLLVSEAAVWRAMRRFYDEEGLIIEGSAAAVVAALYERVVVSPRGPVAAVVSGGNIDAAIVADVLGTSLPRTSPSR